VDTGNKTWALAGRMGKLWDPDTQYACTKNTLCAVHFATVSKIYKCQFYIVNFRYVHFLVHHVLFTHPEDYGP